MREESRCGHFREDFPVPKDEWTANIVTSMDKEGGYQLKKIPVVQTHLKTEDVDMPIFPVCGMEPTPCEG